MKFMVLGPLEMVAGSERVELSGNRQHVVAAMLLLNANRVVSIGRLVEAIYGTDPPPTARSQAQIAVSALRRLFVSRAGGPVISTRGQGYLIETGAAGLDSLCFAQLVTQARHATRAEQAVAAYRDALRLWRGPALDGIDSQLVRAAASRLDEERICVHEDRISVELQLGRQHELIGELTELIEEYPLREQLRGQLMLALYRCGRTAEALQVYRVARRTMIGELGIEPGDELKRLEHAVLTGDPGLDLPGARARAAVARPQVPSLLPTDIADFTGRAEQLGQLAGHLAGEARRAVPIIVLAGKGGVGKTSLAVHTAHQLAGAFPDGRLFADLHGQSSHPVSPTQALERFLRALGLPGSDIPEGLDERAEVYRNQMAGRRILVVLDDASDEGQVTPLLPGDGAAGVIVTSRRRLAGLAGARHIEVNVFDADQSLELLAQIAGAGRVQAQHQAAVTVAERCGHLPLALRIAGARLSARPHWRIHKLVERLDDERNRLDELSHAGLGIRASISLSYQSTSEPARTLFRRLALLDLPHFSSWLSAPLLDLPAAQAEDLLDDLVSAQLVETWEPEPGTHRQYRFHDLIRVFAREQLTAEEPAAEQREALERALGAMLYLTEQADRRYFGGAYVGLRTGSRQWPLPERLVAALVADPLSWYEHERGTLVAGVRQAAQAGLTELCWQLAISGVTLFEPRVYLDDWQETHATALAAARQAGDVRGHAAMLYSTGALYTAQQRFAAARDVLGEADRLFTSIHDDLGIALVGDHIAFLDRLSGQLGEAARRYEQVLAILERTGDKIDAAHVLHGLARVKLELDQVDSAQELLAEALRLMRASPCLRIEAQVLHRMGEANLLAQDLDAAAEAFGRSLAKSQDIGDPVGEAYAWLGLGLTWGRQHQLSRASQALERALSLGAAAGERLVQARAMAALGEVALLSGNPAQAAAAGQQAAQLFRSIGATLDEAKALTLVSHAGAAAEISAPFSRYPGAKANR